VTGEVDEARTESARIDAVQVDAAQIDAPQIDWRALRAAAVAVMKKAYAPYSEFKVGCAALVDDGRIVVGCNVENSAWGVILCAECGLVSSLHATGGGTLVAFTCVNSDEDVIMPCGRCRQLLLEAGGRDLLMETTDGDVHTLFEMLPLSPTPRRVPKDSLKGGVNSVR
jgi:cytidine deaminase